MSRKNKEIILKGIRIEDVANEGKSVARVDGMVVFVHGAVPGDVVDLRVTTKKKAFMEAMPIHFHEYSQDRSEPFCEHFGLCGGCKWQHLPYEKQLHYKQKLVVENLARIGKTPIPESMPILPSANTIYYRNKLEYSFTDKRWLMHDELNTETPIDRRGAGFHVPGHFDKVLDVKHCYLQGEPSNQIRLHLKEYSLKMGLPFFSFEDKEGVVRQVVVRTANTGDVMCIVIFATKQTAVIDDVLQSLQKAVPSITSLFYMVSLKVNSSYGDLEAHHYAGEPYITEEMEGLHFRVGPKSFYQTNSAQAYELYKVTRDFAQLTGKEVVYDLYTGTGTIAQFVAKQAKEVIGIEYVEDAVGDARANALLNGIDNAKFYAGDMKDLLNDEFMRTHSRPDVIITDPPRAGMHPDVVEMLLRIAAPRIVYVSCNAATQARDIAMMAHLYEVKAVQPVDMFPHTHHVENVALLEMRR